MSILETICRTFGVIKGNQKFASDDELRGMVLRLAEAGDATAKGVIASHAKHFISPRAEGTRPTARKPVGTMMPRPTVRNLIYHVCPLKANDGWIDNIRQLQKRLGIFNGKKVVAIAKGEGLHSPAIVQRELPGCEFLVLPNCPVLREVVTFLPLLLSVANEDYREATFYGHTKANSTAENQRGAWAWAKMMYNQLLDFPEQVMADLETHDAVGTTQMIWHGGPSPYPNKFSWGGWAFCGTFWWFRHDSVFTRPNWMNFQLDRYAAEAWLSGLLPPERCKSRFQPWPLTQYPAPTPYDASLYPGIPNA